MIHTLTENFWRFETDNDLFSLNVNNVEFWVLIRFELFTKIRANKIQEKPVGKGVGRLTPLKTFEIVTNTVKNYFFNDVRNIEQSDLLFYGHPRRKKLKDGLWWDVYFDPLIEEFNLNYSLIESSYNGLHLMPSRTKNIYYFDVYEFYTRWISKKKKLQLNQKDLQVLDDLQQLVCETFNVKLDVKNIALRKLTMRKQLLPYFTKVLKTCKPKALIVSVAYFCPFLVEAAKSLNIPVIEFQHGTIYDFHMGYSYPMRISSSFIPDHFFLFGEFWKKAAHFPVDSSNLHVVGYPYFSIKKEELSVRQEKSQVKDSKSVLFISQGTIGVELSKLAVELKQINPKITILYKLHASEYNSWEERYPWLLDSGVSVIHDDRQDLYQLIVSSNAVVGVYSTVVYEALGLNAKVYLLNLPSITSLRNLIEDKLVTVISSATELNENLNRNIHSIEKVESEMFFNSEWRDLFPKKVQDIISQSRREIQ